MVDAKYFRATAAHCRRLADISTNREVRDLLDDLAREFEQRAEEIERGTGPAAADC